MSTGGKWDYSEGLHVKIHLSGKGKLNIKDTLKWENKIQIIVLLFYLLILFK